MGHSAVHEHLQTLRRWYKVKRREAPPSQPTCSSGALRSVGCFGCANSRLSSVIAQKQMCAKYRTLPNSDLEQWINKRANQFVGELNSSLSCFIADEFSFINSMQSTPVLGKTSSIHISPPQPPEFSTWETTLTVIFSSVLIPGAILYGLFCGKADEKAKLLKMISTAAEKLQELSDNYVKEVRDQLRKEDINNIIDYKS